MRKGSKVVGLHHPGVIGVSLGSNKRFPVAIDVKFPAGTPGANKSGIVRMYYPEDLKLASQAR